MNETKRCSTCKVTKEISKFSISKWNRDGSQSECKECNRIRRLKCSTKYSVRSKVYCDLCKRSFNRYYLDLHMQSRKHLANTATQPPQVVSINSVCSQTESTY